MNIRWAGYASWRGPAFLGSLREIQSTSIREMQVSQGAHRPRLARPNERCEPAQGGIKKKRMRNACVLVRKGVNLPEDTGSFSMLKEHCFRLPFFLLCARLPRLYLPQAFVSLAGQLYLRSLAVPQTHAGDPLDLRVPAPRSTNSFSKLFEFLSAAHYLIFTESLKLRRRGNLAVPFARPSVWT